ncbi:MAG TPA: thioredoxin domain-containing protein [Polyangia bacterium]|jgi:protein-disulfide isomerase|nr:thioredoxin domain-containing protein [Polyangia bacterium]
MRAAKTTMFLVKVTLVVVGLPLVLSACSKHAPETIEAPASAAEPPAAAQDTTPPPGLDISKFDELQKKVFFRIVNSEPAICGQAQSLIQSAKKDSSCRRSLNAVRYVAKLVDEGYTDSEISEALAKRYRNATPKFIDVSEAPMKGNPNAKVTLVEFADYECPHCKRFQPVLRQILDEFPGEVKLYFKHYPLPQHTNARLAAEAAVAAQKQGKFWPFEEKLWVNQDSISPAEIEKYAKETGLDVAKFRKDLDSPAVKERVQKDRVDGSTLGLSSTPTLYIDGKEFTDNHDVESVREWVKEEIANAR